MVAREARELYEKVCNDPDSVTLPQEVRDFIDNWIRSDIINLKLKYAEFRFSNILYLGNESGDYILRYFRYNMDKVVEYLKANGYTVDVSKDHWFTNLRIEW